MEARNPRTFRQWVSRYISLSLIVVVGLAVYMLFFSDNSVQRAYVYDRQIDSLKEAIDRTSDSLLYYRDLQRKLNDDEVTMERVVREQYHMQRSDEDVYVVQ